LSNWFEEHPIRSILGHTFLVAGITWVAFEFVFDENKLNVHKAEVENLKAEVGQYKAKVEVLESRISHLTSENTKLHSWLVNTPKTIPHLEAKLNELETKNTDLAKKSSQEALPAIKPESVDKPYYNGAKIEKGESFFDPLTTASLGVNGLNPNYTADVQVTLPEKTGENLEGVKPGTQWPFTHKGKGYLMILHEANWLTNGVKVAIQEVANHKKQRQPDA
jgi:prefoldin subunit 5